MLVTLSACGGRDIMDPDDGIGLFNISVRSIGLHVELSWDAIENEEVSRYRIERSVAGDDFSILAFVDESITEYTDNAVSADVIYEYQVKAELTNGSLSEPSETVRIIPGLTNTWVLDNTTRRLTELTHDAAHKTGRFFDDLPFVGSFDIDEGNGDIFLLNLFDKTLMQYREDFLPGTLLDSVTNEFLTFDDPSDLDYDSANDEMWIADGNSGNIFHFVLKPNGNWLKADSLHTDGSADEGQVDTNNRDYWLVNSIGKSIEIYQSRVFGYTRTSIGGFTTGKIILALDDQKARAYAVDRESGNVSWITVTGEQTTISTINNALYGVVEPGTGDLWLLADDDEDGNYELIKLSITGGRILEVATELSQPTWMGVNGDNLNVVILNLTFDEPKVATYDRLGNIINTFDGFTSPEKGRIASVN